jgi:RNA-directed DNA polymerase
MGAACGSVRLTFSSVILHQDLDTLKELKQIAEDWLAGMGLRLKPRKTDIRHTLHDHEGPAGFDFLGFTIRQFPASKHHTRTHRGNSQAALVAALTPVIRG